MGDTDWERRAGQVIIMFAFMVLVAAPGQAALVMALVVVGVVIVVPDWGFS